MAVQFISDAVLIAFEANAHEPKNISTSLLVEQKTLGTQVRSKKVSIGQKDQNTGRLGNI